MSTIKKDEIKNVSNGTHADEAAKQKVTQTEFTGCSSADTARVAESRKDEEATKEQSLSEEDKCKATTEQEECCSDEGTCGCNNDAVGAKVCGHDDEKHPLEAENRRLTDEMLRMRAEMENSRKRLHRLFEEKAQEKSKQLLLDIITLLDNFERAMNAGGSSKQGEDSATSASAVVEGIKMMEEEFLQTLSNKWGLTRYNSMNLEFNPSLHEAMMKEYSDKVSCETVTEEFMKGYMFYEKVLRPAKVKVTVPKTEE